MPEGSNRGRSVSGEFEDSDLEDDNGSTTPAKPGRKKNPNSQAARRDQNRIAQREFRLRKQQRIRDLEARVEILSGGQDEALTEVRNILKDLMQENHTLRGLLRGLAAFIGEGAGGFLPKLGWDLADFNNFVNRSETDTAWESYQKRKKGKGDQTSSQPQKRAADEDGTNGSMKRPRAGTSERDNDNSRSGPDYSLLVPLNASVPAVHNSPYATGSGSAQPSERGAFQDLLASSSAPNMFIPSPTTPSSSSYRTPSSSNFTQGYMPPMNPESALSPLQFSPIQNGSVQSQMPQPSQSSPTSQVVADDDDDSARIETHKLISYHLDNFARNSAYCLPASLRPTLVQRTIPHEGIIDRIVHPELRDRIILLRGQFDLVDCLYDYRKAVTVHGDDVLAHANWEIGESWLRKYEFLVDSSTLNICNRWRRERGEPELRPSDLAPRKSSSGST